MYWCEFCGKNGHKKKRCFYNPENPNNRLPRKLAEKLVLANFRNSVSPNMIDAESKLSRNNNKIEMSTIAGVQHQTTVKPPKNLSSYFDSGATIHIFHSLDAFVPESIRPTEPNTIFLADGSVTSGTHEGDVIIPFDNVKLRLIGCIYAPDLGYNLISVGCMADKGIKTSFTKEIVTLELLDSASNSTIHIGEGVRDPITRLYKAPQLQVNTETAMVSAKNDQSMLWHRRLAHLNFRDLANTHKVANDVPILHSSNESCRACRLSKAHKLPFHGKFERATRVGQMVHSDIVGPLEASYAEGWKYMCTFVDDYSRFVVVVFMRHKHELYDAYREFVAYLTQMTSNAQVELVNVHQESAGLYEQYCGDHVRIGRIHSDYGLEYVSLGKQYPNTIKNFSPPYTPELNGIAERINRTIVEPARSMLCQAGLPECFWPYAVRQAVFVRNRVRHSTIDASPYYLVTGKKPSLKHLRVFGCAAYVLRLPQARGKFAPRADEGILLGSGEYGIYTVLVEGESEPSRIIKSHHVTFDEDRFLRSDLTIEDIHSESSWQASEDEVSDGEFMDVEPLYETEVDVEENQHDVHDINEGEAEDVVENAINADSDNVQEENNTSELYTENSSSDNPPPQETDQQAPTHRYPRRDHRPPQRLTFTASNSTPNSQLEVSTSDEPTLREALHSTPVERDLWVQAMEEEIKTLNHMGTWEPVDHAERTPLPTHVVLKVKRNADNTVERFRSRIVAGGNHQVYGYDYMYYAIRVNDVLG